MKYQGVKDVCFDVIGSLGFRVSFELYSKDGNYVLTPYDMQFYTEVNDNELLSNYNHDTQKIIITESNDLMDKYIEKYDNQMLVALATDNLLSQLERQNRIERSNY